MATRAVEIVDRGRGPQLSTSRITVLDVFYYLHRGYDWTFVHEAMPSLSREQFDAIVAYVKEHHDELVERDRRADEFQRRAIEAQRARGGIFAEAEEGLTTEERVTRLKEKLRKKLEEQNGSTHANHPD
ncbi:MAG: DUF433 domain-containing protein [Gemmataceae bacterium]